MFQFGILWAEEFECLIQSYFFFKIFLFLIFKIYANPTPSKKIKIK